MHLRSTSRRATEAAITVWCVIEKHLSFCRKKWAMTRSLWNIFLRRSVSCTIA